MAAPEHYKLNLTVAPDQDTFTGRVEIDIRLKQAISVLWLNADKIQVKDATLTTGTESLPARVIAEPKDLVGFAFDHPIAPGPVKLQVNYEGQISRKDMAGIFQVKDGNHWYIYSQFEDISARQAFPCFDEPGYKVPWQVTLNVPAEDGAFSNTPILSENPGAQGMKMVEFAETKPLPSYLVAIAVGPMETVDAGQTGAKHTAVRIIVPKGHSAEAQYVAGVTPDIVNLLEKYFGIPYPYEKLDEVAIPLAGYAMEHPGLVTYGAGFFLMKPDGPLTTKRAATSVIAHELAHQWFGDLVTTAWWDDTWLNEGFASWMANKIVNQYRPEWKMNIDELNSYQRAMTTDELVSSRKVRQEILSDDDIENAFDGITYDKGSGLLNMFEAYMGPEKFQAGIHRYLETYSWKNATSAEFLQILSGNDPALAKAFSSFLDQAGVPLVSAKLQCTGGAAELDVSQERFLPLGSEGKSHRLWNVPLCVKYPSAADDARDCALFAGKQQTLRLSHANGCPAWVDANSGAAGYYRVLYDNSVLSALSRNEQALTLPERVSLLGDVSALTRGRLPLGDAMALVPTFAHDPAPEVVSKTAEIVGAVDDYLVSDPLEPKYRRYLSDLYKDRAKQLGDKDRPGDDPSDRLLRPTLFGLMVNQAEDPEFMAQAKDLATSWLDDHKAVDRDMLNAILVGAAAHGDLSLFERFRAQAKKESEEPVRRALLLALGSFRDPAIVKIALPVVLSDEFDVRQSFSILVGASRWRGTRDAVYDFVKQNWDTLIAKLPTDFGAQLPVLARGYCDAQHRADAEAFFKDRATKYAGGPRILAQTLERIDLCIANKNANEASVTEFLGKY